jgi:effector-binding domain-containing protein
MKLIKITWILVIVALVFGCQKKQEPEQEVIATADQEAVTISEVAAFSYVCLPFVGSYENHEAVIGDFMRLVDEQEVEFSGPMIGIYYNSPMDTPEDSLIWEIGFEVPQETEVSDPLIVKKWEFTKAAKAMHIGPYETVDQTYPKIFEFIGKQSMMPTGPIMERFLSDPEQVAPEELKTEIWVPVSSGQMEM